MEKSFYMKPEEIGYILTETEVILISLHNMGSYYYEKDTADYEKETTKFIDENRVTHRLALIRKILTEAFDAQASDSEKKELEKYMEKLSYWEKPGDTLEPLKEQ